MPRIEDNMDYLIKVARQQPTNKYFFIIPADSVFIPNETADNVTLVCTPTTARALAVNGY
jgi:molybdopterin-guanine dinucleotide biosynthesis protein A